MLRAVLDANLVVSALIRPVGPPGRVLARYLRRGDFQVVMSRPILDEIRASLRYPKVRRYIRFSNEQIELFLVAIEILADRVEPAPVAGTVPADPDDEIYLAAAVGGGATHVVSGDRHLLDLEEFRGIEILRPRPFLDLLDRN